MRIEDDSVVYEFSGVSIAGPVSTRLDPKQRQRARWMEAELYRRADGDGYMFYQASISTVWHLPAGAAHVHKPLEVTPDGLPERPVYCGVLPVRPGREHCPLMTLAEAREMKLPAVMIAEAPQRRVWHFPDRDAVVRQVTVATHRGGDRVSSAAVSSPMHELLAQAARNDPAFRDGPKPVVAM
jgi:hypothetical protein